MDGNKIPKVIHLTKTKNSLREAALRYCAVLELMKTAAAQKFRQQIHVLLQAADAAVDKAALAKQLVEEAKKASAHTDSGFMAGLRGFVDLLEIAEPKLYGDVPRVDNLSPLDPDGFAANVADSLRGNGKQADALATFIESAIQGRFDKKQALVKQEGALVDLNKGRASLSDLKGLIATADAFIHNNVPPASPLLKMLQAPRKPKKQELGPDGKPLPKEPRKKKGQKEQGASGSAPPGTTTAGSTPASVEPAPVTPAPVVTPPAPAPSASDAQVALVTSGAKVNGASGPQVPDGATHA